MQGVFLDRDSLDPGDLDLTGLKSTLSHWTFHDNTAPGQTAERIAGASVVVSNKVRLDRPLFEAAPALKLIAVAATGTNNVDLAAAAERGITVCNVRGYATPSVVEHVFALILSIVRRLREHREAVAAGRWARSPHFCLLDYPMEEIHGLTLGIVGYGELGQAVARTATEGFGMEVLVAQRPGAKPDPGRLPLSELLPHADILSLHAPLTPATRGLIGARELSVMKPNALLINTARGGMVDETALAEALRQGRLGGAGVDVLAEEPPRRGSSLLELDLPNLIVTPHVAWASRQARQRLADQLATNIRAFLDGAPQNVVR